MSYRLLTFYLVGAAAMLGALRLFERPQGISGAAIAGNLRARFLSELALLLASFAAYFLWTLLLGGSGYAVASGLLLANALGLAAWWLTRSLTAPPPPPPPAIL